MAAVFKGNDYLPLKFAFLLLEYCKIRECYAVANAFTIRESEGCEDSIGIQSPGKRV
jgi:hypothetical protein